MNTTTRTPYTNNLTGPTLDEASWRLWGQLPGYDGRIVHTALTQRADGFPSAPGYGAGQRRADALTALCVDDLSAENGTGGGAGGGHHVTAFVDAALATPTNAQAGVTLDNGMRIGPRVLDEVLCDAVTEVRVHTPHGSTVSGGPTSRTIPPTVRRDVLHRDGGRCVIGACTSRHRIELHHIVPRSRGGDHTPTNLATLCWWHHHVGIHLLDLTLDPSSPPQRRRLIQPPGSPPT